MLKLLEQHTTNGGMVGSMLFHQPPSRRTIFIADGGNMLKPSYFLSFPDILFAVDYVQQEDAFIPMQLKAAITDRLRTQLHRILLPNLRPDFIVILQSPATGNTAEDACRIMIEFFWTTHYKIMESLEKGDGLIAEFHRLKGKDRPFKETYPEYLAEWERQTKANKKWTPDLPEGRSTSIVPAEFMTYHAQLS